MKLNKKGQQGNFMSIVIFIGLLFVILFIGFIMVVGSAVINWIFDETVPSVLNLGTVGGANLTQAADLTITPLNNVLQQFTWVTGVVYVMMLIGTMGIAFVFRGNPSRWLIGFFLLLVLMLILGSIVISNMYEDFYVGDDPLATRLQEHTILSFMILYSPVVFTVISFISGIILFSGRAEEGFV